MQEILESRKRDLESRRARNLSIVNDKHIPADLSESSKRKFFEDEYRRIELCEARLRLYEVLESMSDAAIYDAVNRSLPNFEERLEGAEQKLRSAEAQLDECRIIIDLLNGNKSILAFC